MTYRISKNLDIFELKQLADMEALYRQQCQKALISYKIWAKNHEGETDQIALLYGNLQGNVLRANAKEAVRAYWTVRTDFRRWFKQYLSNIQHYPANQN
jgi:hypothetical protein